MQIVHLVMQQLMQTYAIVGAEKMSVNNALRHGGEFTGFAMM
jgi:hypothetical protein